MRTSVTRPRTGYPYLDEALEGAGGPLAIAHRGGATHPDLGGAENTLRAFRHAVSLGYRYLETDVHLTADGELLAFHDETLDRHSDGTGRLDALTLEEVARVRIAGEHPIPRLADLLEEFPGCRFNIDIKAPRAVGPLAALLKRAGAEDRVCVASFSGRRLGEFRSLTGGRVVTAATPAEVAAFLLPGRLPRLVTRDRPQVLQIPWRHRRRPITVATPAVVRRAHALGLHVHVWTGEPGSQWATIDDPGVLTRLIDLGVDGLMVDRTDVLKQVLGGNGLWRQL